MKIVKYILVILAIVSFTSCTEKFDEMNVNPNAQTTGESAFLLTGAQITAARSILDDYNAGIGKWVQYYTHTTTDNTAFWHKSGNDINHYWNYYSFYVDILPNLEEIKKNCEKVRNPNYYAIAEIMEAWSWNYLVDMWGSIPYTDALQGNTSYGEDEQYVFPDFDSEEFIYKDLISRLMAANDSIDADPDSDFAIAGASDIYAGGDMVAWQQFANSLTLRMLMRMSDVDETYAKPLFEQIIANSSMYPLIEDNTEDFGIVWIGGNVSPFENIVSKMYLDSERTYAASTGSLHYLATMDDPRLPALIDPAQDYTDAGNPKYVGCPIAFDADNPSGFIEIPRDSISNIAVGTYGDPTRQEDIITYSEMQFIFAEAAEKGWTGLANTAEDYYMEGIEASMLKLGVFTSGAFNTYYSQAEVDYAAVADGLNAIYLQRYLAQFGQSANTFAMIRRTGQPALDYFQIGDDSENGYPCRVKYTGPMVSTPQFEEVSVGIIDNLWGKKIFWAENAPAVGMYNASIQTGIVEYDVN
ncbi:MAG: SusD/RagB family nutrient-binding outer membrane lipoprotein [Bacteroidales bacterium]|nr:SusD/RagB family nutrient-binding outer membrane lipoprotein [Bacteroidales bacterium]